jgi:archaellum biogenesis ATPase FlaH
MNPTASKKMDKSNRRFVKRLMNFYKVIPKEVIVI